MMGKDNAMKLIGFVVGIVAVLITVYSTFHVPVSNAIQDTKAYCVKEIAEVRKEQQLFCSENSKDHSDIKVTLAEIRADLKYLRREKDRTN